MFGLLRLTRKVLVLCLVAILAAAAGCFVMAGRIIVDPHARDSVEPADVIFVLAGASHSERWVEGWELWREQRAPLILLSSGARDGGEHELRRLGVSVPSGSEIARDVLIEQLGVPADAVEILQEAVGNTAAEAVMLRELAVARGWRRVIVVTSLAHTRRTRYAMERALEGTGIQLQVRGSRFDRFSPSRWWQRRRHAQWVLSELPKLLAYRLGLGE